LLHGSKSIACPLFLYILKRMSWGGKASGGGEKETGRSAWRGIY